MSNTERITRKTPYETSPLKEILVPVPDIMTISGYAGTGKTSLSHILKRLLHLQYEKVGGERFRKWYQQTTNHTMLRFVERDPAVDVKLDEYTAKKIYDGITHGRKTIVEARLAGWVAKKVEDTSSFGERKTFRILLTASDNVRFARIQKRDNAKIEETNKEIEEKNKQIQKENELRRIVRRPKLEEIPLQPLLTLQEVQETTQEREQRDLEIWRLAHPELANVNPFSEANVDEKGEPIYDLIIPTDNLSVLQIAELIYHELQDRKLLQTKIVPMKKIRSSPDELSSQGQIFPAAS